MPWPYYHIGSGIKTDKCLSHFPNPSYPPPGATNWKPPFSPDTFHLHTAIGSKQLFSWLWHCLSPCFRGRRTAWVTKSMASWGEIMNYPQQKQHLFRAAAVRVLLDITTRMHENKVLLSNPMEKDHFLTRVSDSLRSELRYRCIYGETASRGRLHPPLNSV